MYKILNKSNFIKTINLYVYMMIRSWSKLANLKKKVKKKDRVEKTEVHICYLRKKR